MIAEDEGAAGVVAPHTKTVLVNTITTEFRLTVPANAWFSFGADGVLHVKANGGHLAAIGGVHRWVVEGEVDIQRSAITR